MIVITLLILLPLLLAANRENIVQNRDFHIVFVDSREFYLHPVLMFTLNDVHRGQPGRTLSISKSSTSELIENSVEIRCEVCRGMQVNDITQGVPSNKPHIQSFLSLSLRETTITSVSYFTQLLCQ